MGAAPVHAVFPFRPQEDSMKKMLSFAAAFAFAVPSLAEAADVAAGKAKVATVCAACHGATGVSVSESIPNLAAQRAGYIQAQLKALKDGTRKAPIMNAIAAQLSLPEIADVAAYFASLPGAPAGEKSPQLANVARSSVPFPEQYKATFKKYHTIDFPDTKQVRVYFANEPALKAAREDRALPDGSAIFTEVYAAKLDADGKPVKGGDGHFVGEKLVGYTAMEREEGWGRDVPDMLRNENWNYAVFTLEKKPRPGINQAECFACHKPQDKVSYLFTQKELAAVAHGDPPR
jgi:cytochrome c553